MLPGADPDTINIAALHQLIEHREPLSPVARQLNSTPEAVRHVLTLHPANIGPPSTTAALSALAAKLPPEKFTALYRQKRTTLRDIAARYHADRRKSPPSRISTESTPATSHDCTKRSTATGSTPSTSSTAAPCPNWPPKKA